MATYYISSTGLNTNDGETTSTPWQTIAKVNEIFPSLVAGDSILFKRGDTWYGTILIGKSGTSSNRITIGAYGTGDKPIIEGFTTLSSWTRVGSTSVYYASATFEVAPEMLLLDGVVREKGRYPNTGYRSISTVVTTPAPAVGQPVTFTDATLASSPDWDGAEIVIRFDRWTLLKSTITNHTGTSITFNTPYSLLPRVGWGYFIQNHLSTLTDLGDWYYDSATQRVYMHFGSDLPSSHTIRVSTLQYIINNTGYLRQYVTIDNLNTRGSSDDNIRIWNNTSYINVTNCRIEYSGGDGIYYHGCTGSVVDNNDILYSNHNAVYATSPNSTTISNNRIYYTGHYTGNASTIDGACFTAIHCASSSSSNNLIESNTIWYTGYLPINFGGANTVVRNNYINTYCYNKDDGAGIYIFNDRTTGKQVNDNIVLNAIGAGTGTDIPTSTSANGLYTDGGSSNVAFNRNIVGYISRQGYHGNLPVNVTLNGNTFFQCKELIGMWKFPVVPWWDNTGIFISGMNIQNNKFISTELDKDLPQGIKYENSTTEHFTDINTEIAHFGTIDYNYYYISTETIVYILTDSMAAAPRSIGRWASEYGHDIHSTVEVADDYTLNSIGSNLLTNGEFTSNISGWSTTTGASAAWDNTNQLGSGGSIKLTSTQNNYNFYWWSNNNCVTSAISGGVISSANHYILRFLGKSAIDEKTMGLKLYQTGTGLTKQRFFTLDSTNTQKDVLFSYPANVSSGATIRLALCDDPVITYLDNIGLYVANVTLVDFDNYLHFIYNEELDTKYYSLSTAMTDVEGTSYSGTVTLNQWESLVLIGTGTVTEYSGSIIDYYIDPLGIDDAGRSGSFSYPWATLAYACSRATTAGDIIHINPGTFTETVQANLRIGVSIVGQGETSIITTLAALNPLLIAESPTEGTDGNQSVSYLRFDGNMVALKAMNFRCRSNVSVHHCSIVNFVNYGVGFNGSISGFNATIWATGSSFHDNTITNCASYETGAGSRPMLNVVSHTGFLVYNNYMEQAGREPKEANGQCIKAGPVKGMKIYDNILKGDVRNDRSQPDNMQWCIEMWSYIYTSSGTEIYNNEIWNTGLDFGGAGTEQGTYAFGASIHDNWIGCATLTAQKKYPITIEGQGYGVNEVLIYNNHIQNMATSIILNRYAGSTYQNIKVHHNLFDNVGTANAGWNGAFVFGANDDVTAITDNLYFDNNTIIGTSFTGALEAGGFNMPNTPNNIVGTIYIRNNIIMNFYYWGVRSVTGGSIGELYIQNNIIWAVDEEISLLTMPSLLIGVTPQTNIYLDPLLVSSTDLRLQALSPGRNTGLNLGYTTDYLGNAIDVNPSIGAYEYVVEEAPTALIDGLLGYWPLDEISGDAMDSLGVINGTVSITLRGDPGKLGTAYTFNQTNNDYINFGEVCKPTTALSIVMWIKPELQANSYAGIIINQKWYAPSDLDGYLVHIYDNKILFELSNRTDYSSLLSTTSLTLGVFQFIVCTWDGATMKIYINSSTVDNTLARTALIGYNTPFNLYFGSNSSYYDYSGGLDEVGIWNRALTTDEISQLYNGSDGLTYPFTGENLYIYPVLNKYQIL